METNRPAQVSQLQGRRGSDADGVILDASGNVYGATEGGGTGMRLISTGCGIDYELHHTLDGKWKEIVLHDFGTGGDDMQIFGGEAS